MYIPLTLLAYFLNAISVLINKILLRKSISDPFAYVFYISVFSLLALLLVPFTHIPTNTTLVLASCSTLLWTTGAYFLFKALQHGIPSRVVPIIGVSIPLLLFFYSLGMGSMTLTQSVAVIFLIVGLLLLLIPDLRGKMKMKELLFEFFSALFFAVSYIVLKEAYSHESFLTVLVWSRFVLLPLGAAFILLPSTRRLIVKQNTREKNMMRFSSQRLFLVGQVAGGISELLLTFSISLANPALVNSLQGIQYIFLFLGGMFLSHRIPEVFDEKFTLPVLILKLLGIGCIGYGLYLLAFASPG